MHTVFDLGNVIIEIGNLQDLNQYVLLETLDILGDLIRRYGGTSKSQLYYVFSDFHSTIHISHSQVSFRLTMSHY